MKRGCVCCFAQWTISRSNSLTLASAIERFFLVCVSPFFPRWFLVWWRSLPFCVPFSFRELQRWLRTDGGEPVQSEELADDSQRSTSAVADIPWRCISASENKRLYIFFTCLSVASKLSPALKQCYREMETQVLIPLHPLFDYLCKDGVLGKERAFCVLSSRWERLLCWDCCICCDFVDFPPPW